jgi:1,4-alpha-glucan branching enzyme
MSAPAASRIRPEAEALAEGRHGDPFTVLGPHDTAAGRIVRAFLPGARSVEVLRRTDRQSIGQLKAGRPDGFFEGPVSDRAPYLLRITWPDAVQETEDPYSFGPLLGDLDLHLFNEGRHFELARSFGASAMSFEGVQGVGFSVWAPNAQRVAVVGDFNAWDSRRHPMRLRYPAGVWEIFVPRAAPGARYKFDIIGAGGVPVPQKADPLAKQSEPPPATASVVASPAEWKWHDDDWMKGRARRQAADAPISTYEVHLGSWMRPGKTLQWDEAADRLIPYLVDMGFTHLELLPITEHPFGGSWGLACSRRPAATVRRKASCASSIACMARASASSSIGCRRTSRPIHMAWPASTAPHCTSIWIRAKAFTATGTRTSTISADARCRVS